MPASAAQMPLPPAVSMPALDESTRETVIQASRGWISVNWGELIRQRELLFFLVWRDIKVRYKQATLGVAWAVLQPLTQVILFTLIFSAGFNIGSRLGAHTHGPPPPYAIFVFAALLPWQVFARSMQEGGLSLVNQQHLLTKIYFPRLFVPTAAVGGALFDMMISLPIFIVMMAFYRITPPWTAVFLPFLVLATAMLASGMAYVLSALTVTYRDFRFIIQYAVQIWMWATFVMIPVPGAMQNHWKLKVVLYANPLYGMISTYRKILVPNVEGWSPWTPGMLGISLAATVLVFLLGIFYFRRTERRFADIA